MKILKLGRSDKFTIINDDMFDIVNQHKWHLDSKGYVQRFDKKKRIRLHRFIYEYKVGSISKEIIDHKDRNPLNNQINNLREATNKENVLNSTISKTNSVGYKGVKATKHGTYRVYISNNRKRVYTGSFSTAREAAIAYDIILLENNKTSKEFLLFNCPDASLEETESIKQKLKSGKRHNNTSSKYLGVHFVSNQNFKNKPWVARLYFNKKSIYIGHFKTEIEAAIAFNKKSIELGIKERLNII